ncbi:phage tail fiber protein [Pectinatus frisingensis]|uniref:phage tail fiber domain-containing protein n=1 Tax=Pectinatus frisingensis TaxID=865 RepID=UPI0018C81439
MFYTGDGSKTSFTFSFSYLQKKFIKVRLRTAAGISSELTYGIDYTINEYTVTFLTAPASGVTICIYRQTPTDSEVEWADGSVLRAYDMNKLNVQLLHIAEENADSIVVYGMSYDDSDNCWDGQSRKLKNLANPTNENDAVNLAYLDSVSVARQDALAVIEANVHADKEYSGNSATNAKTSETNAAASAAAALASQKTAATSEANAKTSETNAKTSETNAKTSETNAKTSETNAKTSETNAELAAAMANPNAWHLVKTLYTLGAITRSPKMPSWSILECTHAGTSADTEPSAFATVTTIGTTITDGEVTWIVRHALSGKRKNDIWSTAASFDTNGFLIDPILGTSNLSVHICDGTNGTMDLRDRFIVGAGNTYASGATGGEKTHQLTANEMPSHVHSAWTDSQGNHNHSITLNARRGSNGTSYAGWGADDTAGWNGTNWVDAAGVHGHNVGIGATGGDGAHNNLPPYYALAYVMQIS